MNNTWIEHHRKFYDLKRGDTLVVTHARFTYPSHVGTIITVRKILIHNDGSINIYAQENDEAYSADNFDPPVINNSPTFPKKRGRPAKPKFTKEITI